ncbi:putative CBL-interacting protein kinase 13 [Hordeum vulgare]|nr:putative CBL-interacting protein kinase 13 [Hordeum vulgare]
MVSWSEGSYSSSSDSDISSPEGRYVEWVDPEWPPQLKTTLGRLWDMYEDENKTRLSDNLANAEGIFKVLKEKEKMEKDLRFFKLDFAKMVADKEKALAQLGNTQIALSDLKEELEKKKISDKSATNIHQVFRAKAEKELELIKQELELMNQERGKTMKERDEKMLPRDILVHMLPYSHFAYQWTILIIRPQEEAMYTHAE